MRRCALGQPVRALCSQPLSQIRLRGCLGEQQRLAFARVLISQPQLAVLDEATSALDLSNEAIMYNALAGVEGITYLSVGHRPSLLKFHRSRLQLYGADQTPSYVLEAVGDETLLGGG